jgi:hypothetical protein
MSGGAPMAETGFAEALYYKVSKNEAFGRKAIEWALKADLKTADPAVLRQLAIVYDWCGPLLTTQQEDQLGKTIQSAIQQAGSGATGTSDVAVQSARALATIAIADRLTDHGESILKPLVEQWWKQQLMPRLTAGQRPFPRDRSYPLYELFHALRDNLRVDLREAAPDFFVKFPTTHLESHYPAAFPAPEGDFHIPVYLRDGDPDVTEATMSRAAELAMVAYDSNAAEHQFLQGWLMQDRFQLHSTLGAPYEFLWANPYQPGLSYTQEPLVFHDRDLGQLYARSSWDEDALWLGYFDGTLQVFRDGRIQTVRPNANAEPNRIGDALIFYAATKDEGRFHLSSESVYILGLAPLAKFDVEIDDQELREESTDAGGIMVLTLPEGIDADIRLRRRTEN